jgi:hypothetical protein
VTVATAIAHEDLPACIGFAIHKAHKTDISTLKKSDRRLRLHWDTSSSYQLWNDAALAETINYLTIPCQQVTTLIPSMYLYGSFNKV